MEVRRHFGRDQSNGSGVLWRVPEVAVSPSLCGYTRIECSPRTRQLTDKQTHHPPVFFVDICTLGLVYWYLHVSQDDCRALRAVVHSLAERHGVSAWHLLSLFVFSIGIDATSANLSLLCEPFRFNR